MRINPVLIKDRYKLSRYYHMSGHIHEIIVIQGGTAKIHGALIRVTLANKGLWDKSNVIGQWRFRIQQGRVGDESNVMYLDNRARRIA